jgi:hypothetical protein
MTAGNRFLQSAMQGSVSRVDVSDEGQRDDTRASGGLDKDQALDQPLQISISLSQFRSGDLDPKARVEEIFFGPGDPHQNLTVVPNDVTRIEPGAEIGLAHVSQRRVR